MYKQLIKQLISIFVTQSTIVTTPEKAQMFIVNYFYAALVPDPVLRADHKYHEGHHVKTQAY